MKVRKNEEYEFGPYRLNVNECKLLRGREEIKLRPKLFDLLLVFVRHQGKMLEKEELIQNLWPDSIVEESNLTVNINALRLALKDPAYIETVAKRGYRFVPEVRVITHDLALGHAKMDGCDLIEPPGGALPLYSALYISRPGDDEFCHAIERHDSVVLVKGARQVGKTSLLARGLEGGRMLGANVFLIDFQHFGTAIFETADKLLLAMAELIAHQLDLSTEPADKWNSNLSHSTNFERFLRREVLANHECYVVLALDEVDRLFNHEYASEIFGLFRSWHNHRALDPYGPWGRLTLAIAYATEAHLFISDLHQSPFNVGTRLTLEDFTIEQLGELNRRYGDLLSEREIRSFHRLIGGHPYLAQTCLYEIYQHKASLETLEETADQREGPFADHLNRLLISLRQDSELLRELRGFVLSGSGLSEQAFYRLRSAGVVSGVTAGDPRLRCDLYARYLKKHLA